MGCANDTVASFGRSQFASIRIALESLTPVSHYPKLILHSVPNVGEVAGPALAIVLDQECRIVFCPLIEISKSVHLLGFWRPHPKRGATVRRKCGTHRRF